MERIIEIQDMYKIYNPGDNEVRALDGVSLSVDKGDFLAIVGHSGSGKSTLMNMLGCLDAPTSGLYRLEGQDVSILPDRRLSDIRNRFIGFIFQGFHLIPGLSALENVELPLMYQGMGRDKRRRLAAESLERVGLGERLRHRPAEMSGGQQQVTLTASGTADKFGGYCIVGCGDVMLYTAQLLPGHTLSFTLTPPETATYTFTAVWGSHSGETDIKNGSTIGQKTGVLSAPEGPETQQAAADESVYMVRSGDSLWNIAQQHGMDVEKIAAYNDIDKNAVLQIGQEIKIPPADYEITEESVSSSSRQTESHQKADEPAPTGPESAASEPALITSDTPMQKSENSIPSE